MIWLTILRHLAGALAAWLVQWAAQKGVVLDEAQLVSLMIAVYAIVEKSLKHATSPMGEIQPGDVRSETTKLEQKKEEASK